MYRPLLITSMTDHPRVGGEHLGTTPTQPDHPRVGGEHGLTVTGNSRPGSSPRGRGTPDHPRVGGEH